MFAVPDLDGVISGCRDLITLWGIFRRSQPPIIVEELEYLFAKCDVPDSDCAGERSSYESSRVGREVDRGDVVNLHHKNFFVCRCVPYKNFVAPVPRDPSAILGQSETVDPPP